ncbi:MAG: hypothetical protein LBO05_00150 [Deltaproteobacteria bacterium]|jgi:DnaJ-class molecular chaperone|nr:hypothetical protein [Deltaproteobacteria bacterium]
MDLMKRQFEKFMSGGGIDSLEEVVDLCPDCDGRGVAGWGRPGDDGAQADVPACPGCGGSGRMRFLLYVRDDGAEFLLPRAGAE